jgi:hypothetical protein
VELRAREKFLSPQAGHLGTDHRPRRADKISEILVGQANVDCVAVLAPLALETNQVAKSGCDPGSDRGRELPEQPSL